MYNFHDGMRWTSNLWSEAVLYLGKLFKLCCVTVSARNMIGFFSLAEKTVLYIFSLFLENPLPLPKIYAKKSFQNEIMKNGISAGGLWRSPDCQERTAKASILLKTAFSRSKAPLHNHRGEGERSEEA